MTIRAPNPGEPITAAWAAMVVDTVNRLESGVGGGGGDSQSRNAVLEAWVLSTVTKDSDVFVPCRIVDVRLTGDPLAGTAAYWPSQVRYHVRGIRRGGIDLDNQLPVYGRPVRLDEARIYPAGVGLVCFIVRSPRATGAGGTDAQLMLLPDSEIVARRRCDMPGAAAQAAVLDEEKKRLGLPRTAKIGTGSGVSSVPVGDPGGVGDGGGIGP